jgi:hypothetical protein
VVTIVGQSAPIAFRFAMRENVPIYQVRESLSHPWTPTEGRTIWKNPTTMGFDGVPKPKPITSDFKRHQEVSKFIREYIKLISSSVIDENAPAWGEIQEIVAYWTNVLEHLPEKQLDQAPHHEETLHDFWPQTNHGTGFKRYGEHVEVTDAVILRQRNPLEEELIEERRAQDEIFVGERREKERNRFSPLEDIKEGRFIVIRPSDEWERENKIQTIWVGRAKGPVESDHLSYHFGEFPLEWWRPKHKSSNATPTQRYANILVGSKEWEVEPGFEGKEEWMNGTSTIYFWKTRIEGVLPQKVIIPAGAKKIIADHLSNLHVIQR